MVQKDKQTMVSKTLHRKLKILLPNTI